MTSLVFFGNEKLATGISAKPIIQKGLAAAGYEIEAVIDGGVQLGNHQSRLAILAAHGRILPQAVLDQFPLGVINIHPSLLPKYRGSTPIEQAILDGAPETGVSIMKLTAEMDAGPLFIKKMIKLTGRETKQDLAGRLQQLGLDLLLAVLPGIIDDTKKPYVQHHPDRATYTKLIAKADGAVNWSKPAYQIEREVRAYLGWPGSFTRLGGRDVIITQAHVSAEKPSKELAVQAGDANYLVIDRLKPAGKREMAGREFLAGNPI